LIQKRERTIPLPDAYRKTSLPKRRDARQHRIRDDRRMTNDLLAASNALADVAEQAAAPVLQVQGHRRPASASRSSDYRNP
jgi:hypothetical protein